MISRPSHAGKLRQLLQHFPVTGLIGPRQVGKTTLARAIATNEPGPVTVFDLEDATDAASLHDPQLALEPLEGLVVIDEIRRAPEIFPQLRVLVDRPSNAARFLVLGSAGPALLQQSSESLAGRIAYYELPPFDLSEAGVDRIDRLWLRGGFPRSFLAPGDEQSEAWRSAFLRTYFERDLPQPGIRVPAATLRRFCTMVAHYHGGRWNAAEVGRSLGLSAPTINRYLDALVDALLVRKITPWFANLKKRQVKAPKPYLVDSGLLHALLRAGSLADLLGHPKSGASWEGFAMQEVVRMLGVSWEDCHYWATHQGAEIDLLVFDGSRSTGFEFKRTSAPRATASTHVALKDLDLDRIFVIFPGQGRFPLHARVTAVGLRTACEQGLA